MGKMVTRGLKRNRIEIKLETDEVVSKYFKKEQHDSRFPNNTKSSMPTDIISIKSMNSKQYFAYLHDKTNDDIEADFVIESNEKFPKNFVPIYSRVKLMRSKIITPVDSVGCAMLPVTINKKFGISQYDIEPKNYRLQLLMSLMLSSQTKDETNAKAMLNVMKYCIEDMKIANGITLEALSKINEKKLDELIHPVGFHVRKASYIKKTAHVLLNQFEGDVPIDIQGFMSLPGVGPKMGHLALQKSWGLVDGIGVDVHVDRLSKMWKWVNPIKSKTPEHTRKELESWLPHSLWYEINPTLVGFGQVICTPRGRRCDLCLASDICNNVDQKLVNKSTKSQYIERSTRGNFTEWIKYLESQKGHKSLQIKKEHNDEGQEKI